MPKYGKGKTFPTLTNAERALLDMHLSAITTVVRSGLVDLLCGGMNDAPVILTPGKVGNEAWRNLHAAECIPYDDESSRTRQSGGSQVETVRAFLKRLAIAWNDPEMGAFPGEPDLPINALKLTDGGDNTVDLWRVR